MKKVVLTLVVLGVVGAGVLAWSRMSFGQSAPAYRTVEVKRGDVVSTINATGTVEPEELVDVGAQVAGMILSFGTDKAGKTIDYGSQVEEGTVLARIDDVLYQADVAQAKANLEAANSALVRAEADLGQLKAKLVQAQRDWERAQKLGPGDVISQTSYDAYEAAYDVAKSNVAVGEAAVTQARAGVPQAQAQLDRAERNLQFCIIRSPVKGVIIDRRVNTGQTVVSSLNTPSLFLIAKDLTRLQVWTAVNEADISNIHAGQPVNFTVDAYPGRTFHGEVIKTRLNASMTQNVVTYIVEVATDNKNGVLLPYLTASVNFVVDKREQVMTVPNVALRWTPPADRIEPGTVPEKGAGAPRKERGKDEKTGTLWVESGRYVRPVPVTVGLSDGAITEVSGPEVTEGMRPIIGEERPTAAAAPGGTNPFAPQMMRGGGRPQGR